MIVKAGSKGVRSHRLNSNSNKVQRKKVKTSESKLSAMPVPVQNLGRVDHYFQSPSQATTQNEQQHGSEFLRQLFKHPHSSCIAIQGGGTEGYVVNRAFIAEAQLKQEKLLQMVESLKRENEKLKTQSA